MTPEELMEIPLGWIPDVPDARDKWYHQQYGLRSIRLPKQVDLRQHFSSPDDQGRIGSCTAQAVTAALEYLDVITETASEIDDFSRLFVYYNSRTHKNVDSGAHLRDVFKSLATDGACDERMWPYQSDKWKNKPLKKCYTQAQRYQALEYTRVRTGRDLLTVLAEGFPVSFGIMLYESFYRTGSDGVVAVPGSDESAHGGHAMLLVGYDMVSKLYIVRNSWGLNWGADGYCYIPFAMVDDSCYADDFWVCRKIEDGSEPIPSPTPRPKSICPWFRK